MNAKSKTPSAKEAIYINIAEKVKGKTGKVVSKAFGREIFDTVIEEVFASATKEEVFRLNGGFGSFHVRDYPAGSRVTPGGKKVTFGPRKKVRYDNGVVVASLLKAGGDLTKVKSERAKAGSKKPAASGVDLD